jgi:hypothetical protein
MKKEHQDGPRGIQRQKIIGGPLPCSVGRKRARKGVERKRAHPRGGQYEPNRHGQSHRGASAPPHRRTHRVHG